MSSTSLLLILLSLTLTTLVHATAIPGLTLRSTVCPVVLPVKDSDNPENRIVGGELGDSYLRSHLISFHREGCGASLLSKRWGLTAAHCNVHDDSSPTLAGSSSDNGHPLKLKKVHIHPQYDFPKNDLVLLEFEEDVPDSAKFVYLNDNDAIPNIGEYARTAGWGHTREFDNPNTENLLYQVDLPVVTTGSCAKVLDEISISLKGNINEKMHICAGYERGECDSCKADSGGPLVVYDEDKNVVQVGVVAFGVGCARPGVPGGYTRVSAYLDWMKSVGTVFETRGSRKPVFYTDSAATAGPAVPPSSEAPSAPDDSNPAPVKPSPSSEQPDGTNPAPTPAEGNPTDSRPQPPSGGSSIGPETTAPTTTVVGPASPPTAEPVPDGGDEEIGTVSGSSDGQEPSAPGSVASGPVVTPEADSSATPSPEASGNGGAVFADGSESDGGVNVGVVVGSCIAVLAVVAAVCAIVILRRRAAARSAAAGTSDTSDGPPTMASMAAATEAAAMEVAGAV